MGINFCGFRPLLVGDRVLVFSGVLLAFWPRCENGVLAPLREEQSGWWMVDGE